MAFVKVEYNLQSDRRHIAVIANSGISGKLLVGGEFSDPTGKLTLIVLLLILY